MISAAATFLFSVLTIYTYCKLIQKHDDFNFSQQLLWLQSAWLVYYSCGTFIIIYHINLLSNEVNINVELFERMENLVFLSFLLFYLNELVICLFQGKKTFHIVHDIINCCHDADLMVSVCIFRMCFQSLAPVELKCLTDWLNGGGSNLFTSQLK